MLWFCLHWLKYDYFCQVCSKSLTFLPSWNPSMGKEGEGCLHYLFFICCAQCCCSNVSVKALWRISTNSWSKTIQKQFDLCTCKCRGILWEMSAKSGNLLSAEKFQGSEETELWEIGGFKFRRHKIRCFYLCFLPTTLLKVIVPAAIEAGAIFLCWFLICCYSQSYTLSKSSLSWDLW